MQPGYEFMHYRIKEVLGRGTFGITYLCEDLSASNLFAIKEYFPPQAARRASDQRLQPLFNALGEGYLRGLERFIAEAENLSQVRHPNVIALVDILKANNTAYLVMHYEHGESLQSILAHRGTLSEAGVCSIVLPLLDGLEVIHRKGFVHRDLKPSNIFVRSNGSPVLLDFGSARQTVLVSPGYAPIEQYSDNSEMQGPWTDIYALGATLYRAVSGAIPVQAIVRAKAIIHGTPDPYLPAAEHARGSYSQALLQAIDRALEFKVHERPQSVEEWRSAFLQAGTTTRKLRRHRVYGQELIRAAAMILAGVGLIWFLAPISQGPAKSKTVAAATAVPASQPAAPALRPTKAAQSPPLQTRIPPTNEIVTHLLVLAKADAAAYRLSTPPGNSAYERYRQVLKLDPDNQEAARGIRAIVAKYIELANRDTRLNKFARAHRYLQRAAAIAPDATDVRRARRLLYARRSKKASQSRVAARLNQDPPGIVQRIEPSGTVHEQPGSRFAELRRRMGGELPPGEGE